MRQKGTFKLYVNKKLVSQRKEQSKNYNKEILDMWKKTYALDKHNYVIYLQVPSKMNSK